MEDQKISNGNLKFLCSYGGKILLRNSDVKLRYVGGLTRVLSVDRSISFAGSWIYPPSYYTLYHLEFMI